MNFIVDGLDAISAWILDNTVSLELTEWRLDLSGLDQTLLVIALALGFVMFLFIGVHGIGKVQPAIWVPVAQLSPQWYGLLLLLAAIPRIRTGMLHFAEEVRTGRTVNRAPVAIKPLTPFRGSVNLADSHAPLMKRVRHASGRSHCVV